MKPKHTPGPWTFICDDQEKPGQFKGYIQGDIGGCIAHVWPDRETPTGRDNAEANARLIAQAPAMLDLLQRLNAAIHREDVIGHFELQDVLDLDDLMKAFGKN